MKILLAVLPPLVLSAAWATLSSSFTIELGDFPAFYTAAVIASHGDFRNLHDEKTQIAIQKPLTPTRPDPVYFVRPHIYAAALVPFALLPMRQSFIVWIGVHCAVLIACWFWAHRRFGNDAVTLMALFPAAIMSFSFGQDVVLFLGLFVLSYFLFEQDRPLLSGFILGLAFIKPHLMVLIPIVLLFQRRWKLLAGLALGGLFEALGSLALGGFAGAQNYLRFLRVRQHDLSPTPERQMNVYAIARNLHIDSSFFNAALVVLVLVCVAAVAWRGEWWHALSAAIAGTMLISPHTYLYDSTLVILPAILLAFQATGLFSRGIAVAFCTPIPCLLQLAEMPWTGVPALVIATLLAGLTVDTIGLRSPVVLVQE